jgi:hypothetical protein
MSALLVAAFVCVSAPSQGQDDGGPMAPPPTFEVKRLPSVPRPDAPPLPEQQIIARFASNEDVMRKAYDTYTYTETVRFEEETDPLGILTATGDTYFKPDGQRYWGVSKAPQPTLHIAHYTLQDVMTMSVVPYFFLTTEDLANYNFLYAGTQKLDEINTYVFQVKPKALSRKQRLFEGVIWVDDQDYTIVRTWGKFELQVELDGNHLPFTMFETYRENFEDKYWLPTYTASDDEVAASDGTKVPIKLIIRATNFKPRTDAAPAATPDSSNAQPPASPR